MPTLVVVGQLTTTGKDARQKVINELTGVMEYSRKSEPGVIIYAICVPRDESDEKSLFLIEEYADKEVFDTHMACSRLQEVIQLFTNEPVLAEPPTVYQLEWIGDSVTKPEVNDQKDPCIVFADILYKKDQAVKSYPYWKAVAAASKDDEPKTFIYGICKNKEKPDVLHSIEVYESKDYLWDVHAKSNAVAEGVKKTKDLRDGLVHRFLKLEAGYFYKKR